MGPHAILDLHPHHLWAQVASQDSWLHITQAMQVDKQWLMAFCVTQATFLDLLE